MNTHASKSRTASITGMVAALALFAFGSLLPAQELRAPELPPGCEVLQAPAGNVVSLHLYADGFQTYQWDAASGRWLFTGPVALLYAQPEAVQPVGSHYAGPTWVSNSGSGVVGRFVDGRTVDPTAIPWLLLEKVTTRGPGPFEPTTYIQRVNTTGGLAPARAGTPNEIVWVPYTAEYYFYRAK